ncbi:hypothetical protein TR51_28615 [Kitasatospora griseola]|uniref:Uncharacterized protein n=1 Tax=Kitasatospora griseola TaxID=2064 RepID=A0A0D0PR50_KITGR|nr:hypothetical protein TR51_28615 [Kitasatospora griseola]
MDAVATLIEKLGGQTDVLARHGLSETEFIDALPAVIEKIRGRKSAAVADRKEFLKSLLQGLVDAGIADRLEVPKYGDDTVYRLAIEGFGDVAIIQKGCPDGNHSSIDWTAPDWAAETYLWWICDSPRYHPGEHIAKGVNRLRRRFFGDWSDTVDGVIFHNDLCGGPERRCPKQDRAVNLGGMVVPPPCVYVMPDREEGVREWNWNGTTERRFPALLLSAFGIHEDEASSFIGHVGFMETGRSRRNVIASRYGLGQATTYRS